MPISYFPDFIKTNYEIHEWRNASSILNSDFPTEWDNICEVLTDFRLLKSHITVGGGNKSMIAHTIDNHFHRLGWKETKFDTSISVIEYEVSGRSTLTEISRYEMDSPTHQVDEFKNKVAIEVEWNNKDPFFDRDLNNFRLLFDLRVISVGIIITRCDDLQQLFNRLEIGSKYGQNTTHMNEVLPRLEGGSGGGCPTLVFGISPRLYVEDI